MKIGGYLRCSTDKQSARNGHVSIEMQKKCVYERLLLIGLIESKSEIIWYIDEGVSGESLNRPKMTKLINDIKNEKLNLVVAYDLARISRDLVESTMFTRLLEENSVKLICVYDTYNASTAGGRLEANIKFVFNQYEREKTIERTNDGLVTIVENKRRYPCGGNVLYGYKNKDKELIIDQDKAKHVKKMFDYLYNGFSIDFARNYMNNIQKEKYFSNATINYMIHNIKYSGFLKYKGLLYADIIPKIIEPKIQAKVIEKVDEINRMHHTESYILKGVVYCSECGTMLTCTHGTSKTGEKHYYYKCRKCKSSVSQKKLENQLCDMKIKNRVILKYNKDVRNHIKYLKNRKKEINDRYIENFINDNTYIDLINDVDKKIANLSLHKEIKKGLILTDTMDFADRRQFYMLNFDKLYINLSNKEIDRIEYKRK